MRRVMWSVVTSVFLLTTQSFGAGSIISPSNEDEYLDTATISVLVDPDGELQHRIRLLFEAAIPPNAIQSEHTFTSSSGANYSKDFTPNPQWITGGSGLLLIELTVFRNGEWGEGDTTEVLIIETE